MNAASKALKVAVSLVLALIAYCALTYLVAIVFHRMFGTVGGNF